MVGFWIMLVLGLVGLGVSAWLLSWANAKNRNLGRLHGATADVVVDGNPVWFGIGLFLGAASVVMLVFTIVPWNSVQWVQEKTGHPIVLKEEADKKSGELESRIKALESTKAPPTTPATTPTSGGTVTFTKVADPKAPKSATLAGGKLTVVLDGLTALPAGWAVQVAPVDRKDEPTAWPAKAALEFAETTLFNDLEKAGSADFKGKKLSVRLARRVGDVVEHTDWVEVK